MKTIYIDIREFLSKYEGKKICIDKGIDYKDIVAFLKANPDATEYPLPEGCFSTLSGVLVKTEGTYLMFEDNRLVPVSDLSKISPIVLGDKAIAWVDIPDTQPLEVGNRVVETSYENRMVFTDNIRIAKVTNMYAFGRNKNFPRVGKILRKFNVYQRQKRVEIKIVGA